VIKVYTEPTLSKEALCIHIWLPQSCSDQICMHNWLPQFCSGQNCMHNWLPLGCSRQNCIHICLPQFCDTQICMHNGSCTRLNRWLCYKKNPATVARAGCYLVFSVVVAVLRITCSYSISPKSSFISESEMDSLSDLSNTESRNTVWLTTRT